MPQYLDHHKSPGPPPTEMIEQVSNSFKSGPQADPTTGVKGVAWMYNDDEQWCITEAPNAEAVHKYHEAMGLNLGPGDVTEINVVR
jgi:hypothetical protein